jgi:phosphoenolpyruvate carboxykinase (ATP)
MVTAALNGDLDEVEYRHDDIFNLEIPQYCPNVPSELLNPVDTWANKEAYEAAAKKLAKMFRENFETKYPNMPEHIVNAGPSYFE